MPNGPKPRVVYIIFLGLDSEDKAKKQAVAVTKHGSMNTSNIIIMTFSGLHKGKNSR